MFVELAVASSIHFFIPFGHRAIYSPSFIGGEISEWGKEGLFGSQKAFTDIGTNKQLPNETNRFNWPPLSLPSLYSFPSPLFDTADFFFSLFLASLGYVIKYESLKCHVRFFPFPYWKKSWSPSWPDRITSFSLLSLILYTLVIVGNMIIWLDNKVDGDDCRLSFLVDVKFRHNPTDDRERLSHRSFFPCCQSKTTKNPAIGALIQSPNCRSAHDDKMYKYIYI